MPKGGDHFNKYESKRRTDGRLCLDDLVADSICRMLAEDEDDTEIIKLLAAEGVDQKRIDDVRGQPLAQRRVKWLRKIIARDNYEPETPDECLKYVKSRLVSIDKSSDTETKDKIVALRELGKLAIDERKNGSGEIAPIANEAMSRLTGGK